jgi:hypothetical protein
MRTHLRLKLVIRASAFATASLLLFFVFNIGDVLDSRAGVSGDYRSVSSGNWEDAGVWEVFNGTEWIPAESSPDGEVSSVVVSSGQKMTLSDEVTLSGLTIEKDAELIIESNLVKMTKKGGNGGVICEGELIMGSSIIDGEGDFIVGPEATLKIGSSDGIHKKEKKGNIQLKGKREFHKDAFYVFNGTVRQHTGNALPSSIRNLVIDNKSGVELDQSVTVTHYLGLRRGIFFTGLNQLTLGSSVSQTVNLDHTGGALNGKVNYWYGQSNLDRIQIPLSDQSADYVFNFRSDVKAWQKGMIEFTYGVGVPDDSKKSPFEARQVVVGISGDGFFNARMSNGPDEAWLKYTGSGKDELLRSTFNWNISTREHSVTASVGGASRVHSFSNLLYGPQPFSSKMIFRFFSESASVSFIQLSNTSGRMVFNTKMEVQEGYNQVILDLDEKLAKGDYVMQISNASEIQTMKVVK